MAEAGPHVIIVRGGFGGVHATHALRKAPVRVTVVDRTNHSVFSPLLYQVATCGLSADEIAAPIRLLLRRQQNAEVLMGEVTGFDRHTRIVLMGSRQLHYDYLIIATGTQYNYFGHDDWPRFPPSLKTVADAARIRHRILHAFERAELETDGESVRALLTLVLVGGGPTGIELAGALAELARFTLRREYRHIDTRNTRILLLEAGSRILAGFPERLAEKALAELKRKRVQVITNAAVTAIDQAGVVVNRETRIGSRNVIWTAGVRATGVAAALGAATDHLGRIKVRPDLSTPGHPEVFVIGDLMVLERDGQYFSPGSATVAIQQGLYVGDLIARRVTGRKEPPPFRYRDKGKLATVGRSFAIADFGRTRFVGLFAWLLWWTVHIMYLAGLWNRFQVLSTWMWAYLTYQRSVRILTPESAILQQVSGRIQPARGDVVAITPAGQANAPEHPSGSERGNSAARE
jgi:NADH dehydrogenase